MTTLNITTRTLNFVDETDLNAFINSLYKPLHALKDGSGNECGYSCRAMDSWEDDSSHEFTVEREALHPDEFRNIADWLSGADPYGMPQVHVLLQDMCNNGHIEPGEYMVQVY